MWHYPAGSATFLFKIVRTSYNPVSKKIELVLLPCPFPSLWIIVSENSGVAVIEIFGKECGRR